MRVRFQQPEAAAPAFVDENSPPGLRHRSDNRLVVKRPQGADRNHLRFDAVGGERRSALTFSTVIRRK